ncbi:anti-sigma-I factor RsgI family protein [Bhargavaea cecembensis]|nr:hypothetical protein [Bhargavaea cecembensis]
MNKIKGIVVEQNKGSVVILTPDGRFIKGESENREIGSESLVVPSEPEGRLQTFTRKPAAAALLAAAVLILLSALFLPFREPALAFIQLEVNPAVEFGIDSEGKVRELTPLNDDGSALIRTFGDWDGKNVTVLLGRIFAEYGEADRELTVTSVESEDGKLAAIVNRTVHFIRDTAEEEGMLLQFSEADRGMRDRAMSEGVPISRLLNQNDPAVGPSPAKHDQKKTGETEKPSPAGNNGPPKEDSRKPDAVDGPAQDTRPKAAETEKIQPPGNSGQAPGIRKKETPPPASKTQGIPEEKKKPSVQPKGEGQKKPAGPPPEKEVPNGKPEKSAKPEKASPQQGPAIRNNVGNPPAHAGPDRKSTPPGHAGQDKQTGPPAHAGPKQQEKPDGQPGADRESPSKKQEAPEQDHSSNTGQKNKNSGNGKGGNGNGTGL